MIKWTWLKEKVNGPLAFETKYNNVRAIVMLHEGQPDWHIQVWHSTKVGLGYSSYDTPYPGTPGEHDYQPGFDTAAEAKREAEKYIREFAAAPTPREDGAT